MRWGGNCGGLTLRRGFIGARADRRGVCTSLSWFAGGDESDDMMDDDPKLLTAGLDSGRRQESRMCIFCLEVIMWGMSECR